MRTRKALSTVIGAVFAIIALTTTVTYISYSMGILDNYNQSVLVKNQQLSDINTEKFQISSVTVSNSKINITVTNTGNLPIKFTKIWVQNTTTAATSTSWVNSYVPTNNFVAPGGTLTNIGQNIPVSINSANSYNVKLVTSRGNTQQITLNSANAAPLNIQLFAAPAAVVSGFKTELIMIVTNNGSATLTNVTPAPLPAPTGAASCNAGSVSPSSYKTMSPGSTAIFKWDVTTTMVGSGVLTCTYTLTQPLQNGYSQTVQATIAVQPITFTETLLAQNTGIMTLNYSTFRFTQSGGTYSGTWFTGWNFTASRDTGFKINMTNNNSTSDFYVSSYSQIYFSRTGGSNTGTFYIVNAVIPGNPIGLTAYCGGSGDWCLRISSGQTVTLYFGAYKDREGTTKGNLNQGDTYLTNLLLYGKFATSQNGAGTKYAQSLPYIAWLGN
ncbi:MAG: hypothetical protein HY222_07395 [Thaumarchaeota archaeon]|nr:hypothetical protein [Nitrososphaerota archaeon]MBI3642199.1 hypothetical protein [Nitrososphaerota archaeon]